MATFDGNTIESYWNLGIETRIRLLMIPYPSGAMNYWAESDYSSLPWGVRDRLDRTIEVLENLRLGKTGEVTK